MITKMSHAFTRMATIRMQADNIHHDKDGEQLEVSYTAGRHMKWYKHLGKHSGGFI